MSWHVDFESDHSVSLVHDEAYLLYAKRGAEDAEMTEWRFGLTDTDSGEQLIHSASAYPRLQAREEVNDETRDLSNDQHLWSVLEKYKQLYPP